ncbi:MAG: hypothetical protein Fur0024_2000 [Patescibacteria group bacterium]
MRKFENKFSIEEVKTNLQSMKEVKAISKYLRVSPRKLRMRARAVTNLTVQNALTFLQYENSKSAEFLYDTIKSAASNATNNFNLDFETLIVKNVQINSGPVLKRTQARARGRSDRITKPTSHILVVVSGDVFSEAAKEKFEKKSKVKNKELKENSESKKSKLAKEKKSKLVKSNKEER